MDASNTTTPSDVSNDEIETQSVSTQSFYLQPELRRAAGWGITGFVLVAAVGITMDIFVLRRGLGGRIAMSVMCSIGVLVLSQYMLSRVRVDSAGISRRVMWWWITWPWQAIADGRVRGGLDRHRFEFPANPWWSRIIDLTALDDRDRNIVGTMIRGRLPVLDDQPLPDVVTFRMTWPDRREVEFSAAGVMIRKRWHATNFRWSEFEATLWKTDGDAPAFKEGRLVFPDQSLTLRRDRQTQNWSGATAFDIASVMEKYVGKSGLKQYAEEGEAASLTEVEARIERLRKRHRGLRPIAWWSPRIVWCSAVTAPFWLPWPNGLVMGWDCWLGRFSGPTAKSSKMRSIANPKSSSNAAAF